MRIFVKKHAQNQCGFFYIERPSLSFEDICRPQFLKLERVFDDPTYKEDDRSYHFLIGDLREIQIDDLTKGQKKSLFQKLLL